MSFCWWEQFGNSLPNSWLWPISLSYPPDYLYKTAYEFCCFSNPAYQVFKISLYIFGLRQELESVFRLSPVWCESMKIIQSCLFRDTHGVHQTQQTKWMKMAISVRTIQLQKENEQLTIFLILWFDFREAMQGFPVINLSIYRIHSLRFHRFSRG